MRLLCKTFYDFGSLATAANRTIALCQHIDVSVFQEISFLVRAHAGAIASSNTITVNVLADGWTLEEPGLTLTNTQDASATVLDNVQYTSSFTAPVYSLIAVAKPAGRLLALNVIGHQNSSGTNCNITLSIDVTMKSGVPSALPLDYNTYRRSANHRITSNAIQRMSSRSAMRLEPAAVRISLAPNMCPAIQQLRKPIMRIAPNIAVASARTATRGRTVATTRGSSLATTITAVGAITSRSVKAPELEPTAPPAARRGAAPGRRAVGHSALGNRPS